MKLTPPLEQYTSSPKPSHCAGNSLKSHITFLQQTEISDILEAQGYLTERGSIAKKAVFEGLVDLCDGVPIWNLRVTKMKLLELSRKASVKKEPIKPLAVIPKKQEVVWTDLENIGTYFGVGKNKIGTWLDQLGLRGYKPRQVNESGDYDMLDIANESKEKFRVKIPTEKALELGYAQVETIEYTKKGELTSFEKYSWNLEKVKAILVKNGRELDTERKLLLKGKGKNSSVTVSSIDERVDSVYGEWKKLFKSAPTRSESWRLLEKQSRAIQTRIEQRLGYPRFIQDKKFLNPSEVAKIRP